jgi:hypothetical protein
MWAWLVKNSEVLEGTGALVTALAALAALIIIPLQIGAAEKIQQRQAARDLYRGLVTISIERPALVNSNYCSLSKPDDVTAYAAYIEYILYTAEQLMASDGASWRAPLLGLMDDHSEYFCAQTELAGYDASVSAMISELRSVCPEVPNCTGPAVDKAAAP